MRQLAEAPRRDRAGHLVDGRARWPVAEFDHDCPEQTRLRAVAVANELDH